MEIQADGEIQRAGRWRDADWIEISDPIRTRCRWSDLMIISWVVFFDKRVRLFSVGCKQEFGQYEQYVEDLGRPSCTVKFLTCFATYRRSLSCQ